MTVYKNYIHHLLKNNFKFTDWSVIKMKSKLLSIFLILSVIFSCFGQTLVFAVPPPSKYSNLEQYPQMLKMWYEKNRGNLDLENPQTYNEKIQWLKLWDSTPIKTKLADKYLVKEYIKEKIGEKYVVPLLGVWDKFDDIDFSSLPDKFVLKANHGSGMNITIQNKNNFSKKYVRNKFDKWLQTDYAFNCGFELHYHNIKPKIIAEAYIENNDCDLREIKVLCFSGKPKFFVLIQGKADSKKVELYDRNWNLQPFFYTHPKDDDKLIEKPKNLDEVITLSEKLSEGFSLVRVDFYLPNDGSIKFGELTFTPDSGMMRFKPEFQKYNQLFGDLIVLPKEKYDYRKIFETDDLKQTTNNSNNSKEIVHNTNNSKKVVDNADNSREAANNSNNSKEIVHNANNSRESANNSKKIVDGSDNDDKMKNLTENWMKCLNDDAFLNKIKDTYLKQD